MSKELETLELTNAIVEFDVDAVTELSNLDLAIVGGGEAIIAC